MNIYIQQFADCMRSNGIEPPEHIIDDGTIKRFKINGKNTGWYLLFGGDFYAGTFGCWSSGLKVKFSQDSPVRTVISAKQREDWDKARKQRAAEKDKLAAQAAKRCQNNYNQASIVFAHPYCTEKGIQVYDRPLNARVSDGVLLIPIFNRDMQIVNLQTITTDGTKKFCYGAEIKGCFGSVGGKIRDIIYLADGWATACSVSDHFREVCFVAFSAGNLKPVALNLRALYPQAKIIIAADNDLSGVCEKAAIEAARAVGGSYIIPEEPGTDFNDVL